LESGSTRINTIIAWGCVAVGFALTVGTGYAFYHILTAPGADGFGAVALLILVGLGAFLGLISIFSLISSWIGILDAKQAFGLPEGSVRAILTMAFIVIVGVLASYLLTNSKGSSVIDDSAALTLAMDLQLTDAQTFIRNTPASDGILAIRPTAAAGAAEGRYDVLLYPRVDNRLREDVSKQILTMLSTILAAMIGFYFGARPGESDPDAVKRAQAVAEIERVSAGLPDIADLEKRAQQLIDGKFAADDQAANRDKLVALKARLSGLQDTMDGADKARLSASTTAIEMSNSAASATSAAKDIAAAKATLDELEKGS